LFKCPECNVDCIFDDRTYEYICPQCGLIVDDSRLAYDDYHNVAFLDDYKGRIEPQLKRRLRREWRRALRIDHITRGGTNYVVELVKSKLLGIEPQYRSLLLDVKARSLNELFKNYLLLTGLPYEVAREKFLLACKLAEVELPRLRPVDVLSASASKFRIKKRHSKLLEEINKIKDDKVKLLVEGLIDLPEFQPLNIQALIAVCEKWIYGKTSVKNYSVRSAQRYFKSLSKLSRVNAYILASKYNLSFNQICLIKKLSGKAVKESLRRGAILVHVINGISCLELGALIDSFSTLTELQFKLISKYKKYSCYKRACKSFGLNPVDKKLFMKIRDYIDVLKLLDHDFPRSFDCLISTRQVQDELDLITTNESFINFQSSIDVFSFN